MSEYTHVNPPTGLPPVQSTLPPTPHQNGAFGSALPASPPPVIETPTPQAAPAPVTDAPPADPNTPAPGSIAERMAQQAKRERARLQKELEVKQREAKIAERERLIEEREKEYEAYKSNPLKALDRMGLTYEQLTQSVLSGKDELTPEARIQRLEAEQNKRWEMLQKQEEERQAKIAEQEKAKVEAAENQFKATVTDYVKKNAETYEYTALFGQEGLVFDTIKACFEAEGRLLTTEEAAKLVEAELESQFEKALASKKGQAKIKPAPISANDPSNPDVRVPATPSRTLANSEATSSSAPSYLPAKTEQERIARALAALG